MSSTNDDLEGGDYIQEGAAPSTTFEDAGSTTFLCLGVCDMRIGTMFVNGFNLAMILVGVLVTGIKSYFFWKAMGAAFAAGIPGLFLSGVGFYGAKNFDLRAMYVATGGFVLALVVDAVSMQWLGFVVTTIVLFPHAVLSFEMRNGFITKENYSNQEYLSPQGKEFVDRIHSQYLAPNDSSTE